MNMEYSKEVKEKIEGIFNTLRAVDISVKVEEKNGLSYLSWAYAWEEVKKAYPTANYTIYENKDGWNYHHDGKTAWVKVGAEILGLEHIEYLPVMNHSNRSIPLDSITSFDVNKAIQRGLTKAFARHGIGLSLYTGEDLPEAPKNEPRPHSEPARPAQELTTTGMVKDKGKANAGGYVPYTLDNQQMDDGKDIKFTTKTQTFMDILDNALENGNKVHITYSKTEYRGYCSIHSVIPVLKE